jgi:T-complex protein 1 subunit beta
LDKILQHIGPDNHSISVTNDGATILSSVQVDNAAAKVLVDIAKVQDDEVGDGTTSVAVLAGELLRGAETLVNQRIHPQTICAGWRLAQVAALTALERHSMTMHMDDPVIFRADLVEIARTTLSSKLLTHEKEHFANLAVSAVMRLQGSSNLDHIQVLKISGGSLRDSYLEEGFLLPKEPGTGQPERMDNCRILLANTSMDTDKIKIYGSRVKVDSMEKIASIEAAEKEKMKTKVEKILAHTVNGQPINCFINRQLIYNYPESIFAERNIMAIEHADFDGIERLAAVLGGDVVSTFDAPNSVTIGQCAVIEQVRMCVCVCETSKHQQESWNLTRATCQTFFLTCVRYCLLLLDYDWRRQSHAVWRVQKWRSMFDCPTWL